MALPPWLRKGLHAQPNNSFLIVLVGCLGLWAALIFGCYRYIELPEYCKEITQFPYDINSPGCYRLSEDASYSDKNGTAIIVRSNRVRIDLGGFHIKGPAQSSYSVGIAVSGGHDISIQNGSVDGFLFGIRAESDGEAGPANRLLIKNLNLDDNALGAIMAGGREIHLENVVVKNTGARIIFPNALTAGIQVSGENCAISNTRVSETSSSGAGQAAAIVLSGNVAGCTLMDNTLQNSSLPGYRTVGILSKEASGEVRYIRNRLQGFSVDTRRQ